MWASAGSVGQAERTASTKALRQEDRWLEPREGQSSRRRDQRGNGGRAERVDPGRALNQKVTPSD